MKNYNTNSLVNLSNSILKNFGVKTFHDTIPEIDQIIQGHKKIVICLFDGMGQNIVRKHLKEDSIIRRNYVHTVNSTFPPTTAAATTGLLTGKYPIETGWLAWATYFPELNRNLILFTNEDYNTEEKMDKPYSRIKYPTKNITEIIAEEKPEVATKMMQRFPIEKDGPKSLRSGRKNLHKFLKDNDSAFVYFYWDSPDREMHRYGIESRKVHRQTRLANNFMKKVSKENPDTLFIFLADHGHINTTYLDIADHEDISSLLIHPMCLEKRTPSFFIQKGKEEEFAKLFNEYYGNDFELLSKEEVIKIKLFGEGNPCEGVIDSFGDFTAISKGKYSLYNSKEFKDFALFPGHHGGGTEAERLVDVSIFNK